MKIAYITRARMPTEKAHGLQIATMCDAYISLGHDVELVVPKREGLIKKTVQEYYNLEHNFVVKELHVPDVIKLATLLGRLASWVHAFFFVLRLCFVSFDKNTLIITRSPEVAALYSLRGYKVFIEVHDWPHSLEWLFINMLKKVDCIVVNSKGIADEFASYGFKTQISPNGVDIEKIKPKRTKSEMRRILGINEDDFVVMYIGALEKWKGAHILFESSKKLSNRYKIVVAGGNKTQVENLVKIYPSILFLGQTDYQEVGDYQQAADILVVPNDPTDRQSMKYTSPIKLFAHMTSGIPIVITDLPSMRFLVSEDEVFFFDGTENGLVRTIMKVSANVKEAQNRANKAKKKVRNFSWKKRAENILQNLEN